MVRVLQSKLTAPSSVTAPVRLPVVGFGCETVDRAAVTAAIQAGFRHFDVATVDGNLQEVRTTGRVSLGTDHFLLSDRTMGNFQIGAALRAAITTGLVARDELVVTLKLWCADTAPRAVRPAVETALHTLGLAAVDTLVMQWPCQMAPGSTPDKFELVHANDTAMILETWQAMERVLDAKLCR